MKKLPNEETVLLALRYLILNSHIYCEDLIDGILNYFNMNQFSTFEIIGEVNNNNIHQIHEFLYPSSKSLFEFNVKRVIKGSVNVFETRNHFVLSHVKNVSIKFEEIRDTELSGDIINSRFCSIFPEVTRFETKNAFISVDELLKLQECRK